VNTALTISVSGAASGSGVVPPPRMAWVFNEEQLRRALMRHFANASVAEDLTTDDARLMMACVLKFLKSPEARKLRVAESGVLL
jgi:hypothetical protein